MSDFRSMQDMFNGTVDGPTNRQPRPLFLADALSAEAQSSEIKQEAASELRRLHEENSALRREVAALSANALDDYKMIQSLMAERQPLTDEQTATFTTGHCKEKAKEGGCQLHNLQCGFPACDRRAI